MHHSHQLHPQRLEPASSFLSTNPPPYAIAALHALTSYAVAVPRSKKPYPEIQRKKPRFQYNLDRECGRGRAWEGGDGGGDAQGVFGAAPE
eukprot:3941601-Rhodomonas_salina.2